jgi:hypothetical protein
MMMVDIFYPQVLFMFMCVTIVFMHQDTSLGIIIQLLGVSSSNNCRAYTISGDEEPE